MSKVLFDLTHQGHVANIILNKEQTGNSLDLELIVTLQKYLDLVDTDPNIKILVISGKGKNFCSGADLVWMKNAINYTQEENINDLKKLTGLLLSLYRIIKPVICVVQGKVYGGGLSILACSDLTIAAENSSFCFPEIKLGLSPAIVSNFIFQVMNVSFAKFSMLTTKPFNVHQAYQFGLVHEIITYQDLETVLLNNITNMLSLDFNAIVATKKLFKDLNAKLISSNLDLCLQTIADLRVSHNAQLLMNKFLNNNK